MLVGRIEGEPNLRTVIQIKNNLAGFGPAKEFELSEGGFDWKGDCDEICPDASLPACKFYENLGYKTHHHDSWRCENGVVLVYDVTK